MRKLIVVAGLMLLWTQAVRAQQCTGQYANDPTYAMLTAKDFAAQGGMTATLTIQATDSTGALLSGAVPSHNLEVAVTNTKGVWIGFAWNSAHAVSGSWYYTTQSGSTHYGYQNVGLNGNANVWYMDASYVGAVWTMWYTVVDANGNSTTDRASVTVISGQTAGVAWQDGLDTNFYYQTVTTFGGSSMLTSCTECAGTGGGLPHCINATHTPYSTISLTNSNSGESQSLPWQQAGNTAHSNESVSGSASLAISVLPGDSGTISIENKIICIMDGIIFDQQLPKPKTSPSGGSWNPSMTAELAFTKMALKVPTHCTPKLDASGKTIGLICDVAYYCSARSSPPDYQPTKLVTYYYTDPASVPTYWMTMSPGTALVFGKNQPGEIAIWYFPLSTVQQVLTGMGLPDPLLLDIFSLAWVSDSSTQDCTKWISGITPWYMPKW